MAMTACFAGPSSTPSSASASASRCCFTATTPTRTRRRGARAPPSGAPLSRGRSCARCSSPPPPPGQPVHLSNALAVGLVFLAVNSVAIGAFGVLNYAGGGRG